MVLLEAAVVIAMVGLVIYGTIRLLTRAPAERQPRAVPGGGHWRVAHLDTAGETRVVLQKVSDTGAWVLDEHVIATVASDDPDYDAKFLAAMSAARERRALFETEDEP